MLVSCVGDANLGAHECGQAATYAVDRMGSLEQGLIWPVKHATMTHRLWRSLSVIVLYKRHKRREAQFRVCGSCGR